MQQFKNPTSVIDGIKLTLSKKDYTLLGSMDEFWIEKKDNVINVWRPGFKAKFADMQDVHIIQPPMDGLIDLGVTLSDIWQGRSFANKPDESKIQCDGITLFKDCAIATDSFSVFKKELVNTGYEINIPKEVFRYLHPSTNCKIKSNAKIAVFQEEGKNLFYTNLIAILAPKIGLTDESIVAIKARRKELIEKFKVIKEYAGVCHISVNDDLLTLSAESDENQLEVSIKVEETNLKSLEFGTNIHQILKMISISDEENVVLMFDKNIIKIADYGHKILTGTMRVNDKKVHEVVGE